MQFDIQHNVTNHQQLWGFIFVVSQQLKDDCWLIT